MKLLGVYEVRRNETLKKQPNLKDTNVTMEKRESR